MIGGSIPLLYLAGTSLQECYVSAAPREEVAPPCPVEESSVKALTLAPGRLVPPACEGLVTANVAAPPKTPCLRRVVATR